MLMTAGLGTRLRPFTDLLAKPILPVMGVPMAQFALDQLARAGVKKVVANVHHQAQITAARLRELDLMGMELIISDESEHLLGSAGGIKKALKHLGEDPFYLMNADVLTDINLHALGLVHERSFEGWGAQITFALHPGVSNQDQYREFQLEGGLESSTGKVKALGQKAVGRPFWMGAAVIDPQALAEVPNSGAAEFVPTILEPAIRNQKAAGIFVEAEWYDIGSPELWWGAHMDLLEKLETGRLPELWRRRIQSVAVRMADRVWTTHFFRSSVSSSEWVAPCFLGNTSSSAQPAPKVLGPRAVYYGSASRDQVYENGIGYDSAWSSIKSKSDFKNS